MNTDLKQLCRKLGYSFNNISLLKRALTHRSAGKDNNERLEFLGDSVLGFVITEALYEKYSEDDEGKLSRYRSLLVKGDTLAKIARQFNIGDYLYLGGGELKSGGFRRASILADSVEAIIGAIVLDSDINTAKVCVLNWYNERISNVDQSILKDPKTRLQEYLQSKKHALPIYQITSIEGKEHNQLFHVECKVSELDITVKAKGSSRRNAEQQAAEFVLEQLI